MESENASSMIQDFEFLCRLKVSRFTLVFHFVVSELVV